MNIDQLCDYLQSKKGYNHIEDTIHPEASIIGLKIGNGSVEFYYQHKNMFTNIIMPCGLAKNDILSLTTEKEKEEPKIQSTKNVKRLFKKGAKDV
jgi:hypothetical protein